MRFHTGKGLIECNRCDFKTEYNDNLKKHEKSHENDGKFVGKVSNSDIDLINKEIYSYSFNVSDIKKIKESKEINEEDSDFETEMNNRESQERKCVKKTPYITLNSLISMDF